MDHGDPQTSSPSTPEGHNNETGAGAAVLILVGVSVS